MLFYPGGKAFIAAIGVYGHQQRNGFGQVTHCLVAFFKEPVRQPGLCRCLFAQHARGHQLARAPAGQKVHGPGRILGGGTGEIVAQGLKLGIAGSGRVQAQVQRGEGFHGVASVVTASSSSPYSVAKARASRPCSLR
ncbi:hypothetical protein D3C79_852040 [compost metagenome]